MVKFNVIANAVDCCPQTIPAQTAKQKSSIPTVSSIGNVDFFNRIFGLKRESASKTEHISLRPIASFWVEIRRFCYQPHSWINSAHHFSLQGRRTLKLTHPTAVILVWWILFGFRDCADRGASFLIFRGFEGVVLLTFLRRENAFSLKFWEVQDWAVRQMLRRLTVCGELDLKVGPVHTFLRKSLHQCRMFWRFNLI